jgi:hypothetical protein
MYSVVRKVLLKEVSKNSEHEEEAVGSSQKCL